MESVEINSTIKQEIEEFDNFWKNGVEVLFCIFLAT